MKDLQTFKVRVRQYGTGEVISLTHYEIEEHSISLDEIADNYGIGEDENGEAVTFREFDLDVTARPPETMQEVDTPVCVADGAADASVSVPDAVPA